MKGVYHFFSLTEKTLMFQNKFSKKIKIRRGKDGYFVYFLNAQRLIKVNEQGAKILDSLFNKDLSLEIIIEDIIKRTKANPIMVRNDVINFLKDVQNQLSPNMSFLIKKEQMDNPIGAEIEINLSCNLRCKHCFQKNYKEIYMPLKFAMDIIDILDKEGVCEILLTGGEPLLYPQLIDLIEYCEQKGMVSVVTTNGILLDENIIKKLSKFNYVSFLIALEGVNKINDIIRGQGVFNKIDQVLKLLKKYGICVGVNCTITTVNINHCFELIEYCHSLDIPCNFSLFKPLKEEHRYLLPSPKDFFQTIEYLLKLRHLKKYRISFSHEAIIAELLSLPPLNECRATLSGIVIDVYGRMVPCPFLKAAGYYSTNQLPRFNENFLEVWRNHKIFEEFRKGNLRECQARAYIFSKDIKGKDPYGINAFLEYKNSKALNFN